MTPERYRQIDTLLEQALKLQPDLRAAFLGQACGDDEELRLRVEALLNADERAGDFLVASAVEVAAKEMAESQTSSLIGRRLNHYQVLSLVGAGGMGAVYLAQDSTLGRKVAQVAPTPGHPGPRQLAAL